MRIAIVAHTVNKRLGAPRCVAELVASFSKGHDVTVLAGSVADLEGCNYRFVKIPTLSWSRLAGHTSFVVSSAIAMQSLRLIRAFDFDIVHSTIGFGPYTNVVTSHFCQEAEWRLIRKGVLPAYRALSRFDSIDYALYRWLTRKIERKAFRGKGPVGLMVVSEKMRQDMLRYYGDSGREIFVVPNAVDADEFHPKHRDSSRVTIRMQHGIPYETPVILFVGGDWERKGLSTAIAALARMRSKDALLLVVGSGNVAQYARYAQENHVGDKVVFAGTTSNVARYYSAADVFVLPSVYEPFGLVVTEAMASGLPVVISTDVGASYLIDNGTNGFVVEDPLSEQELAEIIDLLLGDAELRSKVGEKARLTAEKLSWDNVAQQTMEVYEHVLQLNEFAAERSHA